MTVLPALTSCSTDRLPAGSLMIKLCGDNRRHTGQRQFNRLSRFDNQMVRVIRVAIESDRGSLDPVCCHRDHEGGPDEGVLRLKPRRQVRATVQEFLALDVAT